MKQLSLFKACRSCKVLKYKFIVCECIAENKKKRKGRYYKKNRVEILQKLKTKKVKEKMYLNEKKYRKTDKGKAATNRAYVNQILKGSI